MLSGMAETALGQAKMVEAGVAMKPPPAAPATATALGSPAPDSPPRSPEASDSEGEAGAEKDENEDDEEVHVADVGPGGNVHEHVDDDDAADIEKLLESKLAGEVGDSDVKDHGDAVKVNDEGINNRAAEAVPAGAEDCRTAPEDSEGASAKEKGGNSMTKEDSNRAAEAVLPDDGAKGEDCRTAPKDNGGRQWASAGKCSREPTNSCSKAGCCGGVCQTRCVSSSQGIKGFKESINGSSKSNGSREGKSQGQGQKQSQSQGNGKATISAAWSRQGEE